jgi:dTDP-4-amino-4,6-dideoxygalactose transaminase
MLSAIPLLDLKQQYTSLKAEIDAAMQAVAAAGHYILGPNVKAFEGELANYCGCQHAAGVANGTDAIHLALRALRIGPGDEVITTPFTFIATSEAIGMVGATPVFVDIDPLSFNIDPQKIEEKITSRSKAIIPVHLYGQPCDMLAIMKIARSHDLYVVEDCAQALGATMGGQKVGTFGDIGCLSFFPSKNLGCIGDGGMVITNNPALFERVEMLRRHGGKVKYHHTELGLNSRLDELQAAILRVKLKHLDDWNQLRCQHAYYYNQLLAEQPCVQRPFEWRHDGMIIPELHSALDQDFVRCVYHQYTIQVEHRDEILQKLGDAGIGCCVYYPVPLHLQEVHAPLGHRRGDFVHAESAANCCLSLPMFPELTREQQHEVISRLTAVLAGNQHTQRNAA